MNDEQSKTHVKVCINQFHLFTMGLVWKRQSKPEGLKHCTLETENQPQQIQVFPVRFVDICQLSKHLLFCRKQDNPTFFYCLVPITVHLFKNIFLYIFSAIFCILEGTKLIFGQ